MKFKEMIIIWKSSTRHLYYK